VGARVVVVSEAPLKDEEPSIRLVEGINGRLL